MREILILAGEASGDLHGSILAERLRALRPDLALVGTGGTRMREAGVEMLAEHEGVVGFVEVIRHIPAHWRLYKRIRARMDAGNVALLMCIDYPGFNMRVAAAAHARGLPVLYYITPQVWASRPGRLATLARIVTKAAVILPFEERLLREHGIDATFVGHPLLDRALTLPDRAAARESLGVGRGERLLALFPGSRAQEIARHLDPFVAAALELQRRDPLLRVVVSSAPHVTIPPARCPFPLVHSASFPILRAADAALCKSGTTTLEATIALCPLVIAYRTSAVEYAVARRLVRIPYIGLVNIVAGREVAREFVQGAVQPGALADALQPLLDPHSVQRKALVSQLSAVRDTLGQPGAAARVAAMALELSAGAATTPTP